MFIVDRIKSDLNFLKDVANYHEDGNTVGLIERMFRDINSLGDKYLQHKDNPPVAEETIVPTEPTVETPKSKAKAIV